MEKNLNLDKYKLLEKDSLGFQKANYLLELKLGTFEVELFKVWDVKNIQLERRYREYIDKFSGKDKTTNIINTVVFKRDLGQNNDLQKVLEEGFTIPKKGGLLFPLGHVRSKLNKLQVYHAVICEVAIGRGQTLRPKNITDKLLLDEELREYRDTIFVDDQDKSSHPNTQDAIIFNKEQILPSMVIEFSYKKNQRGVSSKFLIILHSIHCFIELDMSYLWSGSQCSLL